MLCFKLGMEGFQEITHNSQKSVNETSIQYKFILITASVDCDWLMFANAQLFVIIANNVTQQDERFLCVTLFRFTNHSKLSHLKFMKAFQLHLL